MSDTSMQATPHADLIAQIMGSWVPKTEREHVAAREIERLRGLLREILPYFERGQPRLWQRIHEALGDAD